MYFRNLHDLVAGADFFGFDFDLTKFDTGAESPNGRTVKTGYEHGLKTLFHEEGLLEEIGGFNNQAPAEIVAAVLNLHPSFTSRAASYYARNSHWLVPRSDGADLRLAYAHDQDLVLATELLVIHKVDWLMEDLRIHSSGMWPRIYPGLKRFHEKLDGEPYGILSSGHTRFISRCLELAELPPPAVMVTDDTMRRFNVPLEERVKPAARVAEEFMRAIHDAGFSVKAENVAYFGDDDLRDGKLAENGGFRFACFNPKKRPVPEGMVTFSHYDELTDALTVAV